MTRPKRVLLVRARKAAGFTQEELAHRLHVDRSTIGRWESGETEPLPWLQPKLANQLGVTRTKLSELLAIETETDPYPAEVGEEAMELARRVAASDVSTETLSRLEDIIDELAIKYSKTPPQELLGPVRRHVSYVMRLLDARKTLDEHRRLLVVGGWLSLEAYSQS